MAPVLPPPGMADEDFDRCKTMDDLHAVAEELNEEDQGEADLQTIIDDIKTADAVDVSDEESDSEEELHTPTNAEMRSAMHLLRIGLQRKGYSQMSQFDVIENDIRNFLRKQDLGGKQLTIEQSFQISKQA